MKRFWIIFFLITLIFCKVYAQIDTDSLNTKQLHMITYKKIVSKNYQGWSVQYREFEYGAEGFVIPITLSFGNTQVDQSILRNKNILEVDTYSLGFGFDGYEHLGYGIYLNLGLGSLMGLESVERQNNTSSDRFLIGGTAKTGLLYVPFPDFGLVLGVDVLGKLSNSKGLNRSVGFGFEVGFNF